MLLAVDLRRPDAEDLSGPARPEERAVGMRMQTKPNKNNAKRQERDQSFLDAES